MGCAGLRCQICWRPQHLRLGHRLARQAWPGSAVARLTLPKGRQAAALHIHPGLLIPCGCARGWRRREGVPRLRRSGLRGGATVRP